MLKYIKNFDPWNKSGDLKKKYKNKFPNFAALAMLQYILK